MCQELPTWLQWLLPILVLALEAYLGKTATTKSGSVLELIYNLIRKYLKYRKDVSNENGTSL